MKILAIESSCDETAAAVVRDGKTVLSDVVASQAEMHALYGGVVPELASRRHIEVISALTDEALKRAGCVLSDIDAVACTFAPGLIGALLVGVNFAKSLAFATAKPLIPVHHIRAHVAACYIADPTLEPPFCALVVSGGHTLILGIDGYTEYRIIGSTRDDAAGEAFDKVARVMGLGYPGGRALSELAEGGDAHAYKFPKIKLDGAPYDMSFSGLKTAAINILHNAGQRAESTGGAVDRRDFAASFEAAVVEQLAPRAVAAARENGYARLALCGGVAANRRLREELRSAQPNVVVPPLSLCGDAAAMVGAQGYYELLAGNTAQPDLNAYATLGCDYSTLPTEGYNV